MIPFNFYDKFTSILGPTVFENDEGYDRDAFSIDGAISTLQRYITEIPPLNRQLLLYLLDLFAVFVCSDMNKMTSARIVAAFQPSLLVREPSDGMSVVDHVRAADTLVCMIENQDHFLIGMRGTAADEKTANATVNEATPTPETVFKRRDSPTRALREASQQ